MAVFARRRCHLRDPVYQDSRLVRKQQIGRRLGGAGEDLQRPAGPTDALQGAGGVAQRRGALAGASDDHIAAPEPLDQTLGRRPVQASTGEALQLLRIEPAEAVAIEGLAEEDAMAVEGRDHVQTAF